MKTYSYSLLSKFLYRYAILLLAAVLIFYFIVLLSQVPANPVYVIPALINAVIIFLAWRYYYSTYRLLAFKVICGKETIKAAGFIPGVKEMEIKYSDIDGISGGVFGYNDKGLIFIHDGEHNVSFGIHPSIEDVNSLLRYIIERLNPDLKEEITARIKKKEDKAERMKKGLKQKTP